MKAFIASLALSAAIVAGLVYFWQEIWASLPPWAMVLLFIALAVLMIGSPMFALTRMADRTGGGTPPDRG